MQFQSDEIETSRIDDSYRRGWNDAIGEVIAAADRWGCDIHADPVAWLRTWAESNTTNSEGI